MQPNYSIYPAIQAVIDRAVEFIADKEPVKDADDLALMLASFAIKEMTEKPKASPWTPIRTAEDRPPSGLCLITLRNGTVCDNAGFIGTADAIAWMPLPEPYAPPVNDGDDAEVLNETR